MANKVQKLPVSRMCDFSHVLFSWCTCCCVTQVVPVLCLCPFAMPMKRPLLSLSVDSAADDAAEAKRAERFSADMAAVDRDSFRCVHRPSVPAPSLPSCHPHACTISRSRRFVSRSSRHLVDDVFTIKGIGQGASGVVFLSCHAPTLRLLALKSVSVGNEAAEAAVMLELHAEHENLVPLTATGGACASGTSTLTFFPTGSAHKPTAAPPSPSNYRAHVAFPPPTLRGRCAPMPSSGFLLWLLR